MKIDSSKKIKICFALLTFFNVLSCSNNNCSFYAKTSKIVSTEDNEAQDSLTDEAQDSLTDEAQDSLTDEEIDSLTDEEIDGLTDEEIHGLTDEEIHGLTDEEIDALSSDSETDDESEESDFLENKKNDFIDNEENASFQDTTSTIIIGGAVDGDQSSYYGLRKSDYGKAPAIILQIREYLYKNPHTTLEKLNEIINKLEYSKIYSLDPNPGKLDKNFYDGSYINELNSLFITTNRKCSYEPKIKYRLDFHRNCKINFKNIIFDQGVMKYLFRPLSFIKADVLSNNGKNKTKEELYQIFENMIYEWFRSCIKPLSKLTNINKSEKEHFQPYIFIPYEDINRIFINGEGRLKQVSKIAFSFIMQYAEKVKVGYVYYYKFSAKTIFKEYENIRSTFKEYFNS